MPVRLEQTILDDGVQFVHFFEGRILTGRDLRDEQQADRRQRRRLGRAVGSGVAEGLEVELLTSGGGGASPTVRVTPGWALNREGDALGLCDPVTLELARADETPDGSAEIFDDCADTPPGLQIPNGIGFYVLAIGPSSGFEGEAPKSGLGDGGAAKGCGKRYATLGVRFRLVRLDPLALSGLDNALKTQIATLAVSATAANRSKLRNILAHACLGTPQTRSFPADPRRVTGGESAFLRYGAADDLRAAGALTECEVPLALLQWTNLGVGFLDLWAVRRRVNREGLDERRPLAASDRRRAEAEAAAFQFHRHLDELIAAGSTNIQGRNFFRYLPPAGLVRRSGGGHPGFNATTFYQGLTVSGPHALEGARLTPLLDQALAHRPIDLEAPSSEPQLLWRYRVRENADAEPTAPAYEVFATGWLPFQGDPLFELAMNEKCGECQEAIEALEEALAAQQAGTLRVEVRDTTGAVFAGVTVTATQAATGQTRTATTNAAGVAVFADVAPGQWQAVGSFSGFTSGAATATVPPGGTAAVVVTISFSTAGVGGVIVVVENIAGAVLANQEVEIVNAATGAIWRGFTAADGTLAVEGLPPGEYRITGGVPDGDPIVLDAVEVSVGSRRAVRLAPTL
jgi:hypothetical protein